MKFNYHNSKPLTSGSLYVLNLATNEIEVFDREMSFRIWLDQNGHSELRNTNFSGMSEHFKIYTKQSFELIHGKGE